MVESSREMGGCVEVHLVIFQVVFVATKTSYLSGEVRSSADVIMLTKQVFKAKP